MIKVQCCWCEQISSWCENFKPIAGDTSFPVEIVSVYHIWAKINIKLRTVGLTGETAMWRHMTYQTVTIKYWKSYMIVFSPSWWVVVVQKSLLWKGFYAKMKLVHRTLDVYHSCSFSLIRDAVNSLNFVHTKWKFFKRNLLLNSLLSVSSEHWFPRIKHKASEIEYTDKGA